MNKLEQAGKFLANVLSWSVKESAADGSQAVAIVLELAATDELFGDEWSPMREPRAVTAMIWVVGRDGKVAEKRVDSLRRAIGWDGRFASVGGPLDGNRVRITVEPKNWAGGRGGTKTFFEVKWLDPITGGGPGEKLEKHTPPADLDSRHGSQLERAMAKGGKADPKPPAAPTGSIRRPGDTPPADDIPF